MNNKQILQIVDNIDEKELKRFLSEILTYDEQLMNTFRMNFVDKFPTIPKRDYNHKIWNAINSISDDSGYIDYKNAFRYTRVLYPFTTEAKKLLKHQKYEQAFNILSALLDSIPDTNIDDSNGSTGEIAEECIEIIADILGETLLTNNKINDDILEYILNEIKTNRLSNYGIELYELLIYYIDENYNIDKISKILKDKIKNEEEWYTRKYQKLLDKVSEKES